MSYSQRNVHRAIEQIETAIERAQATKLYSKQGKYKPQDLFSSLYGWHQSSLLQGEQYAYHADSRKRDTWLAELWKTEPHIAGVLNQAIAIDKNRDWTLTGPRRQVNIYNQILRDAEDGLGWRIFASRMAQSYYTSDLGAPVEIGRDGRFGPLRALYNVDPTLCRFTGNREKPLAYYKNKGGTPQEWSRNDFFTITAQPSNLDKYNGLGFCAMSKAVNLVQLLLSVYNYDQEQLGARAPKGLLLLQNISESQWDSAMAARDVKLDSMEIEYFGGVAVLAQEGMDQIDAKLVALSQLPSGFDRHKVTDQIMFGFALIFGYSADEFWPVQFGALGRSRETEIHHLRSSRKGGSDFVLGFQDQLQRELPSTLVFEFEQRDTQSSTAEAQIYEIWSNVATKLFADGKDGDRILSSEQVRLLLISKNILPPEFADTKTDEEVASSTGNQARTSIKILRDRLGSLEQIRSAAELYPQEPIVVYNWPSNKTIRVWDKGEDLFARALWPGVSLIEVPERITQREEHPDVGA